MAEELSVESAVAGEAAAAAVEEVQSREAVQEAAGTAVVAAEGAAQDAAVATEVAAESFETSQQAAVRAEEAQETATVVGTMTAEAFQLHTQAMDEKLREMREYIDSRIPLPAPEQPAQEPDFVEVEADGGTAVSDSGSGAQDGGGKADSGSEGQSGGAPEKPARYKLRHRKS